jgi:transposase
LGLGGSWWVTRSEFGAEAARLDLSLDFDRGARFACRPRTVHECCPVHDAVERTWQHLDFFHPAMITRL